MYEIEYSDNRTLRKQAWNLLLRRSLLRPVGILSLLVLLYLTGLGAYELWLVGTGVSFWGAKFLMYGWQTLGQLVLFWGFVIWAVWRLVSVNRKNRQRFLRQPEGKRRLVLSQHILRIYRQDGLQLLAVHWNRNIHLVPGRGFVMLCAGRSCLAVLPLEELAAQGGLDQLQRTVDQRVREARPLDETLWRSLIVPRPGLVWAASYSAADAWRIRMRRRALAGGAAALLIVLLLVPGGLWLRLTAALLVAVLIGLRVNPRLRERQNAGRGGPVGLTSLPARFELYEDGIQIARGEEGSFWPWDRIDKVKDQRGTLVLKKDGGAITLLPPEVFADEAERRRILEFLRAHIGGTQ